MKGECPYYLDKNVKRSLNIKSSSYVLLHEKLYKKGYDNILLWCLSVSESAKVLKEFHIGMCGGKYFTYTTTHRIIRVGLFWPIIFRETFQKFRSYKECQKFVRK